MENEVEIQLHEAGFQDSDIRLGQKLTRRGLESHLNLTHHITSCESCALSLECHGQDMNAPFVTTTPLLGTGPWNAPLMVIADMPGKHEAKYKTPFIGVEGQLLTMILAKAGIDRNAVYMTYALKCAGTRNPTEDEIHRCQKHIVNEFGAIKPAVVLTVGEYAMKAVRPRAVSIENDRNEVWMGEKVSYIHTHSMKELLGADQKRYKSEVWQDITLAANTVREKRPHYSFDRVGLAQL